MSLLDDYLNLLHRHGLHPPRPGWSARDRLDIIRSEASAPTDSATRKRAIDILEMLDTLDQYEGGGIYQGLRNLSSDRDTDPFAPFVRNLKTAMQENDASVLNRVFFGEFPTGEFNASAKATTNGHLCLLNTGLLQLLFHVSYASCYPIRQADNNIVYADNEQVEPGLSIQRASMYVAVRVISNYLREQAHPYPMSVNLKMDPWGMITAHALARSMITFALAHEVGHAVLGHCHNASGRSVGRPFGVFRSVARSHEQEFEADRWAQRMLHKIDERDKGSRFSLACGGLCFLAVHLMVLDVDARLRGLESRVDLATESHPASVHRMGALWKWVGQNAQKTDQDKIYYMLALLEQVRFLMERAQYEVTEKGIRFIDD